ncbi:MAG: glycosyltransferase family 39 protein [Fibrobacteres bacterium]|nr:glycosyltransferase family 39 protein [Fibrobacterota bacterium]
MTSSIPPAEGRPARFGLLEIAASAIALAVGFHCLALRIRAGGLPSGDEGSWMSVAAELAHGHGFTTRWLEAHFLVPYALPRPDDFRYPALVSLLALCFRLFGFSIETARWAVAGVFLAFATAVWGVSRAAFGRWAAQAALWATVTSLLQLEWNSAVYTEGLFGLGAAGLAAWCLRGERTRGSTAPFAFGTHAWWAGLGAMIGLLYLVRVNAVLFLPGVLWLWFMRRGEPLRWTHPALAVLAFFLISAPWLLRSASAFGNPFHFAGSGGLLRDPGSALTQSHTLTAAEYFRRHDLFFLPRRLIIGAAHGLRDLHRFEHGLEAAPLLLALWGLFRRRAFFGPAFAAGFLLTGLACAYAAYNSWAGVRYFSGIAPLLYAYGFSQIPILFAEIPPRMFPQRRFPQGRFPPRLRFAAGAAGIALAITPILYPHRYYERVLSGALAASGPYAYRPAVAEHLAKLARDVPPGGGYYAASLCDLNFLAPDRFCVGLQELYDPSWFPRSIAAFHPGLVALTRSETGDSALKAALGRMRDGGYLPVTVDSGAIALYLALRPGAVPLSPGTAPPGKSP